MRREVSMKRVEAGDEQSLLLRAQWKILGARLRYLGLADQSKKIDESETHYDPMPWERLRQH
jgi:hypothetical protein